MANSTVASANVVTKFQKKTNRDYVRKGRYGPFTGTNDNAIIQIKQDLKTVSIPLIAKIPTGEGVVGSGQLAGNEKALANFAFTLTPTYFREAVLVDNEENEKSEFQLTQEARPALMNWAMELKRDHITQAFGAIEAGGTPFNYGDASAANLDTWNTNNTDRILYGSAVSNLTAGNHTTSLATIDTTNDLLSADVIKLLKDIAEQASPIVRPFKIDEDQDTYVFFVDTNGFRDLQADTEIAQANREARPRAVAQNPIFSGGDLFFDGVIIKKVPDIKQFIDGDSTGSAFDGVWGANSTADSLATAGASSTRVAPGFFCGTQAIGFGLGRMPSFNRRKEDDYGHQNGVGISLKHDIKKMFYNNKQHGVVTSFYSSVN